MSNTITAPNAPAYSAEAEQVVLGTLIAFPANLRKVTDIITSDAFYEPKHVMLLNTLTSMEAAGTPIDRASIITHLRDNGLLDRFGGPEYLLHLVRNAALPALEYHADVIREKAVIRQIADIGARALRAAEFAQEVGGAASALDAIAADVDALARANTNTRESGDIATAIFAAIDAIENDSTLTVATGLYDLDRMLNGGFRGGQLVTVGARTGQGKSMFGVHCALAAAVGQGMGVGFVSTEMSAVEVSNRLLANIGGTPFEKIQRPRDDNGKSRLTENDWNDLNKASQVPPPPPSSS